MTTTQQEHKIITAFLALSSAAGWRMLPVKATETMSLAGIEATPLGMITGGPEDAFQIAWRAMAAVAPIFVIDYPPPSEIPEEVYLLKRNGLWYRPDACGYTSIISCAGRYTKDEAEDHCRASGVTAHSVSSLVDETEIRREELRLESAQLDNLLGSLQS